MSSSSHRTWCAGSRFSLPEVAGEHPVHDTQTKRYRHLNFFEHECFLEVRVPRVKLPDGSVRLIEPCATKADFSEVRELAIVI